MFWREILGGLFCEAVMWLCCIKFKSRIDLFSLMMRCHYIVILAVAGYCPSSKYLGLARVLFDFISSGFRKVEPPWFKAR